MKDDERKAHHYVLRAKGDGHLCQTLDDKQLEDHLFVCGLKWRVKEILDGIRWVMKEYSLPLDQVYNNQEGHVGGGPGPVQSITIKYSPFTSLPAEYLELTILRQRVCKMAAHRCNGWNRKGSFDYERGMALYAVAYFIDVLRGKDLSDNTYALGVILHYLPKFFPQLCQTFANQ